jgi:hypothetical protein
MALFSRGFKVILESSIFTTSFLAGAIISTQAYVPVIDQQRLAFDRNVERTTGISDVYQVRINGYKKEIQDYKEKLARSNAKTCENTHVYIKNLDGFIDESKIWRGFEGEFSNGYCKVTIEKIEDLCK